MDLFEYQARDIFEEHGVPVLQGTVATSPAEAREAAERIGGPVVVKAQVKSGGRGKAGGIRVAETPDAAHAAADAILGLDIRGHRAEKVMVVECVDIEEEYYFSILLDRAARTFLAMFSVEGGVDIEKLAEERPDAITRVEVDPLGELDAEALVARAAGGRPPGGYPRVEKRAREYGLKYVTLAGSVGIIGNGAGLVMSTLGVVSGAGEKHGGQKPANFLDIGGGASPETMTAALEIVLSDDEALTRLWSRPAVLDHIGAAHEDLERGLAPAPGPSVTRRGRLIL